MTLAKLPATRSALPQPRGGATWKFQLLGQLMRADRVLTAAGFHEFVTRYREGASASTARAFADMLEDEGALQAVNKGLYLNRRARPPAELAEAAPYIRRGAVISLHSVLGEVGFLNNPAAIVTAVVPTSAQLRPNLGEVVLQTGQRLRFYGLSSKFFPAPDDAADARLLLQPGRYVATLRPEAALAQWMHLARIKRSELTLPPIQVDMSTLDYALLEQVAERFDVTPVLRDWLADATAQNFGEEPDAEGERLY